MKHLWLRTGRRALPALLLLACAWTPAFAQPRVLGSKGKRSPAKSADTLFAARVTKAAGLHLDSASRLLQPPGPTDPLAGKEIVGEGERVELAGVVIERLRFATKEEAIVAKGLIAGRSRIDGRTPRYLTCLSGPKASQDLLNKAEALASGTKLPADLGKLLSLAEISRGIHSRSVQVPPPAPGFEGVEVRLKGLWVYRLRFKTDESARRFMAAQVSAVGKRQVMDQVGSELVVLVGPALGEVTLARKTLLAAWKRARKAKAPEGVRGALGVWVGKPNLGSAALLTREASPLAQVGADLLSRCRESTKSEGSSGGWEWKFSDPKTRNHVLYQVKGTRPRFGGVLASPQGLLHVSAPTREASTAERRYLLELLSALGEAAPTRGAVTVPLEKKTR